MLGVANVTVHMMFPSTCLMQCCRQRVRLLPSQLPHLPLITWGQRETWSTCQIHPTVQSILLCFPTCLSAACVVCVQGMCATSAGGRTRWHIQTRGAMPQTLCWTTCRTRTTRPWSSLTSTWCTSTSSASAFDGPSLLQTSLVSPLMVCRLPHTVVTTICCITTVFSG